MGLQAEGERRSAAGDACVREGNHLGQRQLPDPVGAAGSRDRDLQRRWSSRYRLHSHGGAPGGVHEAAAPYRREDLRRPGAHQGQRPDDDLVGLQQLPDEQQRAPAARRRTEAQPDRQGGDGQGTGSNFRADGGRHLRRHDQGRPVRRLDQSVSDDAVRCGTPHATVGTSGRDESDIDERRAADAAVAEVHGPSGRRQAGLHHRRDDREQDPCAVPGTGKHRDGAALRRLRLEDRGRRVQ